MAKKVKDKFKLEIPAGQANPAPPVGPALGQRGLNIMEFCKVFNAKTQGMEPGMPIPVIITAYVDNSFELETKTPPASYLLRKAAKLKKGTTAPGLEMVASLTKEQVSKIAEQKMQDLNANDIEAATRIIMGSARSMGIEVKE